MNSTPNKLYLQWYDGEGDESDEVTWCTDQINGSDIEYIRADIVNKFLFELETDYTIEDVLKFYEKL